MLHRRIAMFFVLLALASTSLFAQASKYETQLAEIDAYVAKARADWKIPGLAMAIVKDARAARALASDALDEKGLHRSFRAPSLVQISPSDEFQGGLFRLLAVGLALQSDSGGTLFQKTVR